MDIGVPLRDLGLVDVGPLLELVAGLTEADWTANTLRRDALAAGPHSVTDSILFKQEWHPSASSTGVQHFEDLVYSWATQNGLDPVRYLPIAREDTDVWPIFTMPDWARYRDVLEPLAKAATGLGVSALFMEIHPDPERALSDGPNSVRLRDLPDYLRRLKKIDAVAKG